MRVWDMEIGDCVLLLAGHTAPITGLAVAASGGLLVSASADRTARVWELEKGQCLGVLRGMSLCHDICVDCPSVYNPI